MPIHFEYSVRTLLATELVLICAITTADVSALIGHSALFQSIYDNFGHAAIAAALWAACTRPMLQNNIQALDSTAIKYLRVLIHPIIRYELSAENIEYLFAFAIGSLLDLDHFIAARSVSFYGATHLSRRPFGHSIVVVTIILVRNMLLMPYNTYDFGVFRCFYVL